MNELDSISFKGQLSPQEFRAIQAVMMRPLTWMWMGFIAVFVGMNIGFGHVPGRGESVLSLVLTWGPLPLILLMIWWSRRAMFRRSWTQDKLMQEPCTGSVSEAGIDWRSDSWQSNVGWDKLHKARMSDRFVLVYSSPIKALAFPRSFFASDDDWTRFRALVERKLPRSRR